MHKTNVQYQADNKTLVVTKYGSFALVFFTVIFINSLAFSATQKQNNWMEEPISISFQNEPLSTVLKHISEQTGVSIAYDQELANEKVTGNYQNVKTSDAITRLFRSKNKSIQVNKAKKIIIVKTFGAKNFIWASVSNSNKQNNSATMTLSELNKMHQQQYKEYKERIANDNEIIEDSKGMTRGELRLMHEQQYKEYKKRIANDAEIIEDGKTGNRMTQGELRSMHEEQYKAYEARIANDDEIIKGGKAGESMTRGELRSMHEMQYAAYKKRLSNDNEVLEGGMTRGELRAMHKQQYKNFQKRIQDSSYDVK